MRNSLIYVWDFEFLQGRSESNWYETFIAKALLKGISVWRVEWSWFIVNHIGVGVSGSADCLQIRDCAKKLCISDRIYCHVHDCWLRDRACNMESYMHFGVLCMFWGVGSRFSVVRKPLSLVKSSFCALCWRRSWKLE